MDENWMSYLSFEDNIADAFEEDSVLHQALAIPPQQNVLVLYEPPSEPNLSQQNQLAFYETTDSTYLLGNKRELTLPTNSTEARVSVLNSLRTILPSLCMLRFSDIADSVDETSTITHDFFFIIQDWYFKETELSMLLIDLESFKLFDAFVIRDDLFHMFVAKKIFKNAEPFQSFAGFYIRSANLEWISLNRAFCSAVKICKYNESLHSWLTSESILKQCFVLNPPSSWHFFESSMSSFLFFTPQLPNLSVDGHCHFQLCICKVQNWSLHTIPTSANILLTKFIEPSIVALQSYYSTCNSVTAAKPKRPKVYKHSYNPKGERYRCLFSKRCLEPAVCYWTQCCKSNQPVSCKTHAKKCFYDSESNIVCRVCKCPKHKISSKVAFLLF